MARQDTTRTTAAASGAISIEQRLEAIEEQGRQTFELVRTIVTLLLPAEGREGPSLEDLIAAMIAQQRDLVVLTRGLRSDVQQLGTTLPDKVAQAVARHGAPAGASR